MFEGEVYVFIEFGKNMYEWISAAVLGVVQGLTEFLPVSSSGHLEIAKVILGDNSVGEQGMLMTVVLHFATALSTLVVFRKEVLEILSGLFQLKLNEHTWFCIKIVISMIPAVLVGLLWEEEIEALFSQRLLLVGLMLLVTGVLLFLADRAKQTDKSVGIVDAIIIGVSQAIAILPGISRSGATISTSVLLGIDRERAAKFSFLMVVPLIFGKIAKDVLDASNGEGSLAANGQEIPLIIGFAAAFLTGLLACTWMIKLVKNSKLSWFSYYCFVVGIIVIIASFFLNNATV
jgi:undecaprenyl-diphosphatase